EPTVKVHFGGGRHNIATRQETINYQITMKSSLGEGVSDVIPERVRPDAPLRVQWLEVPLQIVHQPGSALARRHGGQSPMEARQRQFLEDRAETPPRRVEEVTRIRPNAEVRHVSA